jgi:hypothetical protein
MKKGLYDTDDIHVPFFSVGGFLSLVYWHKDKNSYTAEEILEEIKDPLITLAGVKIALEKLASRYDRAERLPDNTWIYKPCTCRICQGK